jgi:hypothetical protein
VTRRLKGEVKVPLIATNRINDPAVAEAILARGDGDMVSMARPFLADADFVNKAAAGRADEINTCIACNQACLDQIFNREIASCLVNPRACHETIIVVTPAARKRRIAVVGAGPAGLACATTAAEAGHHVELFDVATEIGGQFNLARRIPGKEEFAETLRYYRRMLERLGVRLISAVASASGISKATTTSCSATGVVPRTAGDSRHRSSDGRELHGYRDGQPAGWKARRHHRRRRHRVRRGRIPHASRRFPTTPRRTAPSGGSTSNTGSAADLRPRTNGPRLARCGCCSASRRRSAKDWRRPRDGFGAPCSRSAA